MKNKLVSIMTTTLILAIFTSSAFAEGTHGPVENVMDAKFLFTVINFFILFMALVWFLRKPARKFFGDRASKTKEFIDQAQRTRDATLSTLGAIEAKLKKVDDEANSIIHSVKEQSETEKQNIIAEAHKLSEKIRHDTKNIASQEVVKARHALQAEAVKLAAGMAEIKIKERLTAEDQIRLGADFVTKIKQAGVS